MALALLAVIAICCPLEEPPSKEWDSYVSGGELAIGSYLARLKHSNSFHRRPGWELRQLFIEEEIRKNIEFRIEIREISFGERQSDIDLRELVPNRNRRVLKRLADEFGADEVRRVKRRSVKAYFVPTLVHDKGFHKLVGLTSEDAFDLLVLLNRELELQSGLGISDQQAIIDLVISNVPKSVESRLKELGLERISALPGGTLLTGITAAVVQRFRFAR